MSNYAKNTAIFSLLTLCSRITGLLRLMVFAYAIGGRTVLADAFQLAYLVPNTIYEFIAGGVLSAVFIPILVREQEAHGKKSDKTWQVANLLLGTVGFILAAVSLIAIVGSPLIIKAMTAMGTGETLAEKQRLATYLFYYFAPQILFLGINAIFMAILNSLEVFAVTAAAPIINNIVCIAAFIGFRYGVIDITGLAIWTTMGTVAMALIQLPFVIKEGMKIRPRLDFKSPVLKAASGMGWPIIVVSIANLIGWSVRSNLLSTVLGAFAIYTFCFQIIMMPYGIFAVSIATVLYPTLARHAANKRRDEFISDMSLGFRWTAFILLPISFGIAVLAMPIIQTLFEHRGGRFTYTDSLFASDFLGYYALSIAPYGLVMFATRVFYSMKDTLTPAIINIGGVVLNAIISYLLLEKIGASGIALASTITYIGTTIVSGIYIRKTTKGLGGKDIFVSFFKIAVATLLMTVAVYSAEKWSRPVIVVIESGSRLDIPLPDKGKTGNSVVIDNQKDFQKIWSAFDRPPEALPQIDFDSNRLMLAWGPETRTTSTLQLLDVSDADSTETVVIPMLVKTESATSQTATQDAATSPAYALIQIPQSQKAIHFQYTLASDSTNKQRGHGSFKIVRLLLLVLLGATVYFVSAYLFKMPELESFTRQIKRKLKRKPAGD